jgi:hypothetical protein
MEKRPESDVEHGVKCQCPPAETAGLLDECGEKQQDPEYSCGQGCHQNHSRNPLDRHSHTVAGLVKVDRGRNIWSASSSATSSTWTTVVTFVMLLMASVLATLLSLGLVVGAAYSSVSAGITSQKLSSPNGSWTLNGFKSLVVFGDSYTDESRARYFATHGWKPPPPGWMQPLVCITSSRL